MKWHFLNLAMEEEPDFEVGDYIYVPGIKAALEGDLKEIPAYVLGKDLSLIHI